MYEIRGNNSSLIHWNKNHETVTGYSAKEIKDKNVFDFFYPAFPVHRQNIGGKVYPGLFCKKIIDQLKK